MPKMPENISVGKSALPAERPRQPPLRLRRSAPPAAPAAPAEPATPPADEAGAGPESTEA